MPDRDGPEALGPGSVERQVTAESQLGVWCENCRARTDPHPRTGRCLWCDAQLVNPIPSAPVEVKSVASVMANAKIPDPPKEVPTVLDEVPVEDKVAPAEGAVDHAGDLDDEFEEALAEADLGDDDDLAGDEPSLTATEPPEQEGVAPEPGPDLGADPEPVAGPEPEEEAAVDSPAGNKEERMLQLGPDLSVPVEVATHSMAILAVRGAGKSNGAAVLAEEYTDLGIPWVAIDPKGDWWGIAKGPDDEAGLPVVVFGGVEREGCRHIPLTPGKGRVIAEMIFNENLSCVLDVSHMDDEDRSEFLAQFANRLFELHLSEPSARHIIIEEAHEVIPQNGGNREMIKAWTRFVTQGRQRGLGITLVSQRSANVHKNVLTQTGILFAMRTTSPQDCKVIEDWTKTHHISTELVGSLPSLDNGEAWVIAPHFLQGIERFTWRRRWTHDSGEAPGVVVRAARELSDDDIDRFASELNGGRREVELPKPPKLLKWDSREGKIYRERIVELLGQQPRSAVELCELIGLTVSQTRHLCKNMKDAGEISSKGYGRSSKYTTVEEGAPYGQVGQIQPEDPGIDQPNLPARSATQEVIGNTGEAAGSQAQISIEALAQLERLAGESGLAIQILTARYLEVLLRRIEGGDYSPEMLDRFERIAGFVPPQQSAPS